MKKEQIFPCLWFEGNAAEAARFYCQLFPESAILSENPVVVMFELRGTKFMGLNGRGKFTFNESVSFVIQCEDQEEIDRYWFGLSDGGNESRCGWLRDRYGISWQVVPRNLGKWMSDPEKGARVQTALMKMGRLIIQDLMDA